MLEGKYEKRSIALELVSTILSFPDDANRNRTRQDSTLHRL